MRYYFTIAASLAGAMLCAHAAAETTPAVAVQIDHLEYKENGRIDADISGKCSVEEQIRKSTQSLNELSEKKGNRSSSARKPPTVRYTIDIRIDKLARIAWQGPSSPGGVELDVTAILPAPLGKRIFMCRADWRSRLVSATQCSRLNYCTDRITKQILESLATLPRT